MKKILIAAGCLCIAGLVWGQATAMLPYLDYLGLHIGSAATEKIGFHGATPVVQGVLPSAGTTTASGAVTVSLSPSVVAGATAVAVTPITATYYMASQNGGTCDTAVAVVTNVTVNAVYGFASSQATITTVVGSATVAGGKYGFTTSTQPDALVTLVNSNRTILINKGLAR